MLALGGCTTKTVGTSAARTASAPAGALAGHGFVDGELVVTFTAEGEEAIAAGAALPAGGRLRLGVPSLDRLNAKYLASAMVAKAGEPRTYVLKLADDANVLLAAKEYGADPLVERAAPRYALELPRPQAPGAVRTEVRPAGGER